MSKKEDLKDWITGLVEGFLAKSPLNNLQNKDGAPAWDEALVGFASGADPLFQERTKRFRPYAPGPWLSGNLLKPQHQPGPSTGVRPAIRIGRDIGKSNPAAATGDCRTLTK